MWNFIKKVGSGLWNFVKGGITNLFGGSNAGQNISNLANAGANIYGAVSSNNIAAENLQYQKDYNQQVFERADTSFQRAAEDLRKAGLSQTLAAGTPANVGATAVAPQRENTGNIVAENMANALGLMSNLKLQDSETKANLAKAGESEANVGLTVAKTEAQTLENEFTKKYGDKARQLDLGNLAYDFLTKQKNLEYVEKNIQSVAEDIVLKQLQGQKYEAEFVKMAVDTLAAYLDYEVKAYDFNFFSDLGYPSSGPLSDVGMSAVDALVTKTNKDKNKVERRTYINEKFNKYGQQVLSMLNNIITGLALGSKLK